MFVLRRCAVEQTVTFYPINDTLVAFRFQSFRFRDDYASVYLHCRAYTCASADNGDACDQNCLDLTSRRRRNVVSARRAEYQLHSGPIVVIGYSEMTSSADGNLQRAHAAVGYTPQICIKYSRFITCQSNASKGRGHDRLPN